MNNSEILARACANAADDKKAENIVVLDMAGISSFTDFFVICTANSEPQLKAISSEIRDQARVKLNQKTLAEDGFPSSQWIVVDFGDVIVHIFHTDKREVYSLETLWSDAKVVDWAAAAQG